VKSTQCLLLCLCVFESHKMVVVKFNDTFTPQHVVCSSERLFTVVVVCDKHAVTNLEYSIGH